jgi:hypothetical protein
MSLPRSRQKIATRNGEFIGVRRTKNHVTIWIEGRNDEGPSVSATVLDGDSIEALIWRLAAIRAHMEKP